MNKGELVEKIAHETGASNAEAGRYTDALLKVVEDELKRVLAPGSWALFCYPMGPGTPIWFPTSLVAPRLERAGFAEVRSGVVGPGEWTAGRR